MSPTVTAGPAAVSRTRDRPTGRALADVPPSRDFDDLGKRRRAPTLLVSQAREGASAHSTLCYVVPVGAMELCASEGVQILGGAGYIRGTACERIYRETKVMAIGGGATEIMKDLAAKQLGI